MQHGRQDRIQITVDRYLGHCSITPQPFEHLSFLLNTLVRDPAWTPQDIEEVGQCVRTALNRAADNPSHRDHNRGRTFGSASTNWPM